MTSAIRQHEGAAAGGVAVKKWTDRELLTACIATNEHAWRALFRRYDGPLRGAVYKRLASFEERLPSDYRDDMMGAFYLKHLDAENDPADHQQPHPKRSDVVAGLGDR